MQQRQARKNKIHESIHVDFHTVLFREHESSDTWERDVYLDKGSKIVSKSFRKKARMVKQLHMVMFTKKTGNIVHWGEK